MRRMNRQRGCFEFAPAVRELERRKIEDFSLKFLFNSRTTTQYGFSHSPILDIKKENPILI